jgi:hypothetical protein
MATSAAPKPDALPETAFKRRGNRRAGGLYSPDSRYRYHLWQRWDSTKPNCCFVLASPGPNDELGNDPTLARLARIAASADCGGLELVNLFALRAPGPRELEAARDPIGPSNDIVLMHVAESAGMVVCAWGQHGLLLSRGRIVKKMLVDAGLALHVLAETVAGHPEHPSLVAFDRQPIRWR